MKHLLAINRIRNKGNVKVIEIDTRKARYFDIPWHSLGAYGKQKFENLIVLSNTTQRMELIKVCYSS